MSEATTTTTGGNNKKMLNELSDEHYAIMHRVKEYWINRVIRGGANFTKKDIEEDINWMYEHIGDMGTNKPHIFVFDSYAAFQLGYNILRVVTEDTTKKFFTSKTITKKKIFHNPAMDRVYDFVWFGESGESVHESMDARIKQELQEKIWEATARQVGDTIGVDSWDILRQNVVDSISKIMWTELWRSIAFPASKKIRSRVTEKIWNDALNNLVEYIGEEVNQNICRKVENNLESILSENQDKLHFIDHFIGLGNWAGWISFYDFFHQAGVIKEGDGLTEEWVRFRRVLDKGIWAMSFYEGCVLVCKLPTRIRRDEDQRQLHSLAGPAIEWQDGTGQYYIHGINFNETFANNLGVVPELWKKITSGDITWPELFQIRNIEQRRVAIRVYGPERIMKDANAVLIDRSKKGNELYKIEQQVAVRTGDGKVKFINDDNRIINRDNDHTIIPEMRIMHYKDPSTDRWYYSFVPNNINKADDGMAWKFQMPTADYINELKVEA